MKRRIILFFIFFGILLTIGFFVRGFMLSREEDKLNQKEFSDINFLVKFISNHKGLLKEYLPKGNLILLDKDYNFIHLFDRNVSIDKIENLYVIQGNTCVFKDVPDLKEKIRDPRFNKCYTIAATKDFSNFQIAGILKKHGKFVAYVTGNIDNFIIKDYKSNFIVKNGDTQHLPYMPFKGNSIEVLVYKGKPKIKVLSNNVCEYYDGKIVLNSHGNCDINIRGEEYVIGLVYPDGSYELLKPVNGQNVFSIHYEYDGLNSKLNVFDKVGESVYNLVRYSFNSEISVKDNKNNVLTIRGTKFGIKSMENSLIYLDAGFVELITEKGDKYIMDYMRNIIGFDKLGKIVEDVLNKWKKDVANIVTINVLQDFEVNSKGDFVVEDNTENFRDQFDKVNNGIWSKGFVGRKVDLVKGMEVTYNGFIFSKKYGIFVLSGKMNQIQNLIDLMSYLKNENKKYVDLFNEFCNSFGYTKLVTVDKFYPFIRDYKVTNSGVDIMLYRFFDKNEMEDRFLLIKDKFTVSKFGILYYDFNKNKLVWGTWGEYNDKNKGVVLICE